MNITRRHLRLVAAAVLTTTAIALSLAGRLSSAEEREVVGAAEDDTLITSSPPDDVDDNSWAEPGEDAHFGRVTAAYVGPAELVLDRHELVVGGKDPVASGDAEQDHVIRDVGEPPLVLPVSDAVVVTRVLCDQRGCTEGHVQSYGEFTLSVGEGAPATSYFLVRLEEGVVVRVEERYVA